MPTNPLSTPIESSQARKCIASSSSSPHVSGLSVIDDKALTSFSPSSKSKDAHTTNVTASSSPSSFTTPEGSPRSRIQKESRWVGCKTWLKAMGSLELENSGSVARDHLAAERTFLAYVRTSLACAAAGVALVQLLTMGTIPPPRNLKLLGQILGALIELFGLVIVLIAVTRYFSMQRALIAGQFPTAGVVLLGVAGGMLVLVLIAFALMLAIALS